MSAHPQFAEALALYAMGTLDSPEGLAALEAHLGTCGDCRRELEALRADVALLALSATGPQPPVRSRQRLLSAIAAEPRLERRSPQRYAVGRLRPRWVTFAPVMVMLLLAVFSILLWLDARNARRELRHMRPQMAQMQAELEQKNKELADAKAVTDLLHAPDAKQMVPIAGDTGCESPETLDMAFELGTDNPWVKWDQPFTGIRDWPHYEDLESQGTSIRQQENLGRIVADDWVCERDTPVIAAA